MADNSVIMDHTTHDLVGRFRRELEFTEERPTTTSMYCREPNRISLYWSNGIEKARTANIQVKDFTSIHTSSVESIIDDSFENLRVSNSQSVQ